MELWLPWFYITSTVALLVIGIRLFRIGNRKQKVSRIARHVAGVVTSSVSFLATLILLLGVGCERHSQLIRSPDGKYVARVLVTL